jgi:hypothetical protein
MSDYMGWIHFRRQEFNELYKDQIEPADYPPPEPAKGNFKW